jgi:hypothetical protein
MCAKVKQESLTWASLRSDALRFGSRNAVKVNQRMLIDKMLARYSSDFVVFRELIQNADDAKATAIQLKISCITENRNSSSENDFHHSTIEEICVINNGSLFTNVDWERVASIAEGNTNVESIGQFGVGFFSVFSLSEEPIIVSGTEYITFAWQNDDSLATFRRPLPINQQTESTSIILKIRGKYLLDTEMAPIDSSTELNSQSTTGNNGVNAAARAVIPIISLPKLKAYLTKGKSSS